MCLEDFNKILPEQSVAKRRWKEIAWTLKNFLSVRNTSTETRYKTTTGSTAYRSHRPQPWTSSAEDGFTEDNVLLVLCRTINVGGFIEFLFKCY